MNQSYSARNTWQQQDRMVYKSKRCRCVRLNARQFFYCIRRSNECFSEMSLGKCIKLENFNVDCKRWWCVTYKGVCFIACCTVYRSLRILNWNICKPKIFSKSSFLISNSSTHNRSPYQCTATPAFVLPREFKLNAAATPTSDTYLLNWKWRRGRRREDPTDASIFSNTTRKKARGGVPSQDDDEGALLLRNKKKKIKGKH